MSGETAVKVIDGLYVGNNEVSRVNIKEHRMKHI